MSKKHSSIAASHASQFHVGVNSGGIQIHPNGGASDGDGLSRTMELLLQVTLVAWLSLVTAYFVMFGAVWTQREHIRQVVGSSGLSVEKFAALAAAVCIALLILMSVHFFRVLHKAGKSSLDAGLRTDGSQTDQSDLAARRERNTHLLCALSLGPWVFGLVLGVWVSLCLVVYKSKPQQPATTPTGQPGQTSDK